MTAADNQAVRGATLPTFFRFVGASVAGLLALTGAALVDGLVVGKWLGAEALAGVNWLIPIWTLLFGLVLMLATGGSVVAGRYLGAGRHRAASRVFSGCLTLAAAGGLVISLAGPFLGDPLMAALGMPEALRDRIMPYYRIVMLGQLPQYLAVVLYYFLRVAGQPQRASRALVAGALVNVLLDLLLVAAWGWDIRAAAVATVAAQLTQCGFLCTTLVRCRSPLRWSLVGLRFRRLLGFCANGLSEFVNEVSAGLVLLAIHWLLSREHGVHGVAGFALIHYALLLNIMLACAVAEVVHVLVSQSRGAGLWERALRFRRLGLVTSVSMGAALWCLSQWGGGALAFWLFGDDDPAVAGHAQRFWSVIAPVFFLTGINLVMSAWFTGCQRPTHSALIALSRSLFLPLVFLAALSHWWPAWSFLWALPLAEALTLLLALVLIARESSNWRPEWVAQ